ncbi:hypothetical protein HBI56_040740 [Parastagonospora nodorum]|nr:hypothetical protein HBH53_012320 [Parastagonospora nodorum]KAH3988058.1 hypothetical protein HBH51_005540 [Parastagonospora nodorum]KAH4004673.1 hypothetical protein HBI10_044030 [Parastagonospora nodorum]KAH4030996.1 hypothetical protein HBI13_027480 [Parastagonospora nodorum]KAH4040270.1 hypothetical protein HBI09_025850 [Parastagonospora nodorum]
MKSLITIVAALCSVASAWPLMPWSILAPPATGTQFYQLQAKSATTALNNQWVTLPAGATSYGLATAQTAATKFFVQKFNATNTWAFHNADDTRQLALRGADGVLLYLVDVTNPNSGNIPGGQLMEWATFTMDSNVLSVSDGSTLKSRTFVGVRGTGTTYTLALYDGVSNTTQTISPLTLNIVRSGSG